MVVKNNTIQIVNKSLLEADTQYIAHQCNCVSKSSAGIALLLFNKYPYSNVYRNRKVPSEPGSIEIVGDENSRLIISLYSQYYPGNPGNNDTKDLRLYWFEQCLKCISNINNITSIGFPYNIGCGLAGGDWKSYERLLKSFAEDNKHINTTIYKF